MAAEQRKLLGKPPPPLLWHRAVAEGRGADDPAEQLMGGGIASRSAQLSLTDPKVCRSYIVDTCPHDLFTNTKQDLGPCPRVHSEGLKAEWEAMPEAQRQKYGFDSDYMRDLQKYIDECNRRIDAAQRRLEKTPDEIRQTNVLLRAISDMAATIANGLLEVEILGELGDVTRAYDEFFRVRQATAAKAERERELKALSDTSGPSGHQKLQVCDVCGAYLSRLDNDRRLADHFYGKMHLGYAQMRKTYDAFPKELKMRGGGPRAMMSGDAGTDDLGTPRGPGGGAYGDDGWGKGAEGAKIRARLWRARREGIQEWLVTGVSVAAAHAMRHPTGSLFFGRRTCGFCGAVNPAPCLYVWASLWSLVVSGRLWGFSAYGVGPGKGRTINARLEYHLAFRDRHFAHGSRASSPGTVHRERTLPKCPCYASLRAKGARGLCLICACIAYACFLW